jgi:hypothetical protein
LTATLLTADGRPVKTFDLTGEKTTVDISGLQPGVYQNAACHHGIMGNFTNYLESFKINYGFI